MPALFKRKQKDHDAEATPDTSDDASAQESIAPQRRTRDKDAPTPKRQAPKKKRPPVNPPLTAKEKRERAKTLAPTKDERREAADERRKERLLIAEGHDRGDPLYDKYHMPRDKGKERLLVRDIVDSRHNVGQYFFFVAIIIMFASGGTMPVQVQSAALIAWVAIIVLFAFDCVILSRKVLRLMKERYPKHTQRKAGLCWYAISRSIMFRRLRTPRPRPGITTKTPVEDLGKVFKN